MEVTMELIEQLRKYAPVSYADAKAALETTGGDVLNALIWLEAQGKIGPSGVGSTHSDPHASNPMAAQPQPAPTGTLERVWYALTENRLACSKGEQNIDIPIAVLIALIFFAVYVVVLGVAIGFCLGWRFHFAGPHLGSKAVNDVMDTIDDTAGDIVRQVKDSFKK